MSKSLGILWVFMILLAGCGDRDQSDKRADGEKPGQEEAQRPILKGLTSDSQKVFGSLLKAQSDKEFDVALTEIKNSGKVSSILILTHAMFELPWKENLAPVGRGDLRMRKLRVEKALDHLVASSDHDKLSGRYFKAVVRGHGSVDEAKASILRWTLERMNRFVWDTELKRFAVRDEPVTRSVTSVPTR